MSSVPLPFETRLVRSKNFQRYPRPSDKDPNEDLMTEPWIKAFSSLQESVSSASISSIHVPIADRNSAIGATDLGLGASAGFFAVWYHLKISTPGSVTSAAQITLAWTDTDPLTRVGANVNGNTVNSYDSNVVFVKTDASSPVTYAVSYASNAAGTMQFDLDIIAVRIPT